MFPVPAVSPPSTVAAAPDRTRRHFLIALGAVAAALLGAETAARLSPGVLGFDGLAIQHYREWRCDGAVHGYAPHPYLSVVRAQARGGTNSLGFRGEEWPLERTPGVLRIACLGASTTEGGNLGGEFASYPSRLREALENQLGREVEVLNAGISGWTTAETMLAWFLIVQDYSPDLVILHHAVNDVQPRLREGFRSDYAHSRRAVSVQPAPQPLRALLRVSDLAAGFLSRSEPPTLASLLRRPGARDVSGPLGPPQGTFRRNVLAIVRGARAAGTDVLLMTMPTRPEAAARDDNPRWRQGVAEHNEILRGVAESEGCLLADAAMGFAALPDGGAAWFTDLVHVSLSGNLAKATAAYRALDGAWLDAWR